ncbi:Exocyst complex component 1 [Branchiostoma belcheri]|nr:Exocyst complex component 1 [Branchiostoma belcheri]
MVSPHHFVVKKGLDSLYKKVEKHLCEEENLNQEEFISQYKNDLSLLTFALSPAGCVVVHAGGVHQSEEFISQYKHFEDLIRRCYPESGITLEFTIDDILKFFSDIAQSH